MRAFYNLCILVFFEIWYAMKNFMDLAYFRIFSKYFSMCFEVIFFLHLWNILKLWELESESDSILVLFRGNSDSLCQVYCHFRINMKNNLVVSVIMTMIHAIYKYKWPYFQALVNSGAINTLWPEQNS